LGLWFFLYYKPGFCKACFKYDLSSPGIVVEEIANVKMFGVSYLFYITVMFTMTTGTVFLMWMGEQITAKRCRQRVSMIITLGILSSLPSTIGSIISQLNLTSQDSGQLLFLL